MMRRGGDDGSPALDPSILLVRARYYTVLWRAVVIQEHDRMSWRSQMDAGRGVYLHPGSRAQPLGILEVVGPAWSHLPHFSSRRSRRSPLAAAGEVRIGCRARLGEEMGGRTTWSNVVEA